MILNGQIFEWCWPSSLNLIKKTNQRIFQNAKLILVCLSVPHVMASLFFIYVCVAFLSIFRWGCWWTTGQQGNRRWENQMMMKQWPSGHLCWLRHRFIIGLALASFTPTQSQGQPICMHGGAHTHTHTHIYTPVIKSIFNITTKVPLRGCTAYKRLLCDIWPFQSAAPEFQSGRFHPLHAIHHLLPPCPVWLIDSINYMDW